MGTVGGDGGGRRRYAGKWRRGKRAIPGEGVAGRSHSSVHATSQGRHLFFRDEDQSKNEIKN